MAGLLDFLVNDPGAQLGVGLLAAAGPTTDPNQTGFGQRLSNALQYVDAKKAQDLKAKLLQSQMDENTSQAAYRKAMTDQMARKIAMQQSAMGLLQGAPSLDVAFPLPSTSVTAPVPSAPTGFPDVFAGAADPYIRAVRTTESGGNPNALSPKGAMGDMQVMPGTASSPGFGIRPSDGTQGDTSRVGREYFAALNQKYGDPAIAAIAYNWGPGNTDMWLKSGGDPRKLPAETRNYVTDVLTRGGVNRTAGAEPQPVQPAPQAPIAAPSSRLAQMTPDQLAAWRIADLPDISKEWEIARFGKQIAPGSMIQKADGTMQYIGDPSKGMLPNGRLDPNYVVDQAKLSGATKGAEAAANYENSPIKIKLNDGTEVTTTPAELRRNGGSIQGSTQPPVGFKTGLSASEEAANASNKEYQTKVGADQAEQRKSIMNAGFSAPSKIAKLQQIDKLLGDFEGGRLSQTGVDFASAMNSLGIKVDKNLPNKEAAQAMSREIALSLRNPAGGAGMPGALSDADRNFLSSMTPDIGQTAEGRKQIIASGIAIEKRNQQVSDFARKYEAKYGKLDNGFYSQLSAWSSANPLFAK